MIKGSLSRPSDNYGDHRKGKPAVRRGRTATGLPEAVRLPKGEADAPDVDFAGERVVQAGLLASLASAGALDFTDDFNSFDTNRWSKGDHKLGGSYLDPKNVGVSNGNLAIKLPARTLNGGEIMSKDLYGEGSYSARMKLPNALSSITRFFLYQAFDYASEIDIEIYNDTSRRVMFSTYSGGS